MRVWVLVVALVLLLGALACEPWPGVTWENATPQRVAVYKDGKFAFRLEPQESQDVLASEDVWRPDVRVVAEDGRVLLEDHITWDELKKMGYRIVITDPASSSPGPTATPIWPTPPPAACWGKGPQSPLAPSPASNLRAELVSSPIALEGSLVRLQWDDNADDELCYVIERKVGEGDWSVYESSGWGPTLGPVSTDDVPGEVGIHCYRISYGNYEGRSAYSNEACVDVKVVPIVLTPTPPGTPEAPSVTPMPSPTPLPWPCNAGDDPPYSELAPSPPTDLAAIVVPQTAYPGIPAEYRVEMLWQSSAVDPLCYIVQRREHDGAWRTLGGRGMGRAFGSFDFEPWLGERCYRVAVANEHGRSAWSNETCAGGPAVVLPSTPAPTATPAPE